MRFWSPSLRLTVEAERAVHAGGVVGDAGVVLGSKGRVVARAAVPFGPPSRSREELGRGLFEQLVVPGHEFALTGVGAALGRRREEAALGAEEVQVESVQRGLRQVFEDERRAGRSAGPGATEPGSLTCVAKPSAARNTRYGSPGCGRRGRSPPGSAPAAPSCRSIRSPIFENSRAVRLRRVPKFAWLVRAGDLAVGGVRVDREALRQRDQRASQLRGRGRSPLWDCGTLIVVEARGGVRASVVGLARRLGLKLSCWQPVVAGYSASFV